MNQITRFVIASSVLGFGMVSNGCLDTNDPGETHYYFGDVYDGVKGQQVTNYNIAVEYFGRRVEGTKDGRGGFALPPIPANSDYSVYIDAPGYRPFVSHQPQWHDVVQADRSFHYEAYLFATDLAVADVPVTVTLSDSGQFPSGGSIRLRPTAVSQVYDEASERPAGVTATYDGAPVVQVWENDYDLLSETVMEPVDNGAAILHGNKLVYGVPYQLSLLNFPGYQYSEMLTFTAGVDGRQALVLTRLAPDPLAVSYMSTRAGNPTPDGSLTIVLNQPVELDPLVTVNSYLEAVDNAFSIVSDNTNLDLVYNQLKLNVLDTVQERGTHMVVSGQTITFTWSPAIGLRVPSDPADIIRSVTWGAMDQIRLRPTNGNATDVVTLASLLSGARTVTVIVTP
jgi:hypothetical protein